MFMQERKVKELIIENEALKRNGAGGGAGGKQSSPYKSLTAALPEQRSFLVNRSNSQSNILMTSNQKYNHLEPTEFISF
jgi:hypothetical protein